MTKKSSLNQRESACLTKSGTDSLGRARLESQRGADCEREEKRNGVRRESRSGGLAGLGLNDDMTRTTVRLITVV